MLLYIHSTGLGAVWLGQILKNKEQFIKLINGPEDNELMAVIALGHPDDTGKDPDRNSPESTVFFRK